MWRGSSCWRLRHSINGFASKAREPPPDCRDKVSNWNTEENPDPGTPLAGTTPTESPSPTLFPTIGSEGPVLTDKDHASSQPSPPPLTQDTPSSTSSHQPPSTTSTSRRPQEARQQPQHPSPTPESKPAETAESDAPSPESSMANEQRQRGDAAPTRLRNETEKPPTPPITPEGCKRSGSTTLGSGLDAPTQDSCGPKNPGSNATSADVPTAQSHKPDGPPQDETDEIDVDDDPPSETATDGTNHLPPDRFASKKSPGGLDYVPAVFTPEEEDANVGHLGEQASEALRLYNGGQRKSCSANNGCAP